MRLFFGNSIFAIIELCGNHLIIKIFIVFIRQRSVSEPNSITNISRHLQAGDGRVMKYPMFLFVMHFYPSSPLFFSAVTPSLSLWYLSFV